jgi:hypothetical protein
VTRWDSEADLEGFEQTRNILKVPGRHCWKAIEDKNRVKIGGHRAARTLSAVGQVDQAVVLAGDLDPDRLWPAKCMYLSFSETLPGICRRW